MELNADKTCLRCGRNGLVPDPIHTHWHHCPACEPEWAQQADTYRRFFAFLDMNRHANDPRGRPAVRPI